VKKKRKRERERKTRCAVFSSEQVIYIKERTRREFEPRGILDGKVRKARRAILTRTREKI
jgi:hypothetical protein